MEINQVAFGIWSGGHFMHFGIDIGEQRLLNLAQSAYEQNIRTFISSDVYSQGSADKLITKALKDKPRQTYQLINAIGHDFYNGKREGSAGFQRFTHPNLRNEKDYQNYLEQATLKTLERLQTDHLDLLLLHNPDRIGYSSETVWQALASLKEKKLTKQIGIAPGPANGFLLDLLECFEKYGDLIDWAMIIFNPYEPWPMENIFPLANKKNINLIARVVDYGGFFHGDIKHPEHKFAEGDHRAYRPDGWVARALDKWQKIQPIAEKHNLTPLQLACMWVLAHEPVKTVVPTLIQEQGENASKIEEQLAELANLPKKNPLTQKEITTIRQIGDNVGSMMLKGASSRNTFTEYKADAWPPTENLLQIAKNWKLNPNW